MSQAVSIFVQAQSRLVPFLVCANKVEIWQPCIITHIYFRYIAGYARIIIYMCLGQIAEYIHTAAQICARRYDVENVDLSYQFTAQDIQITFKCRFI